MPSKPAGTQAVTHSHLSDRSRGNPLGRIFQQGWQQIRDFSGAGGNATYLWPRWLVLRAVGIIFIFVFAGVIAQGGTPLIGPQGLTPARDFLAHLGQIFPNPLVAFLRAPSLFWFGSSAGMINGLAWLGLAGAVALALNVWPRMAVFVCWAVFLSFATVWGAFTKTQPDQLLLETALLCIPFAPAGFRPGLGVQWPPRPIAVFIVRWLLFRLMFEAGTIKLFGGDPHWLNFTAMEPMYETTPFPTILGYLDHQLPHIWHVGEILLTFTAEIAGPLLALFAGRRGRWFALVVWTVFQTGIELTNNFGPLNVNAIVLGLLLLDDQMIVALFEKLKWKKAAQFLAKRAQAGATQVIGAWRLYGLRTVLWTQFGLTLVSWAITCGVPVEGFPFAVFRPLQFVFADFHAANSYTLFAGMPPNRYAVEFEGSNDGGQTWRTYDFRYQPQRLDRISPFIAPYYVRFEAALQIAGYANPPSPLFAIVATHLLQRDAEVIGLFEKDPFPDHAPTMIRMPIYRLKFTDYATYRKTGQYWLKEAGGDVRPMVYLNEHGQVQEIASALEDTWVKAFYGNPEAQSHLAYLYAHGEGLTKDSAEAARWYLKAANQGLAVAQFNLGSLYVEGDGVPKDAEAAVGWYRKAAEQGLVDAQFSLGSMYAEGDGVAKNPIEGARWYRLAAEQGDAYSQVNLGNMYINGTGVPKNPVEGLAWLQLAAAAKDPNALQGVAWFEQHAGRDLLLAAQQRSRELAAQMAAKKSQPTK